MKYRGWEIEYSGSLTRWTATHEDYDGPEDDRYLVFFNNPWEAAVAVDFFESEAQWDQTPKGTCHSCGESCDESPQSDRTCVDCWQSLAESEECACGERIEPGTGECVWCPLKREVGIQAQAGVDYLNAHRAQEDWKQ